MKNQTIEHFQYFVGRVCTVLTTNTGRNLSEVQAREHFVIRIQQIDHDGVWGTHPYSGVVSFFSLAHVVAINEEIELDPKNPEHKAMIEEFEQKSGKKVESDLGPVKQQKPAPNGGAFVDINKLKDLAKETRQSNDFAKLQQQAISQAAKPAFGGMSPSSPKPTHP